MNTEDRRYLKSVYCFIAFYVVASTLPNGKLISLVAKTSDPVGKVLIVLLVLAFVPGAVVALFYLVKYAWRLLYIFATPIIAVIAWEKLGAISPIGKVVGCLLAVYLVFCGALEVRHPQITRINKETRKFFTWLFAVPGRILGRKSQAPLPSGTAEPDATGEGRAVSIVEENMDEEKQLSVIRSGMQEFQNRSPELHGLPAIFTNMDYSGWFSEAQKRFGMQSYGRTQDERIALLKQLGELHQQYLALRKLNNDLNILRQEHTVRETKLALEEVQLKVQIAQAEAALKSLRATPSSLQPSERRDPIKERLAEIRSHIETVQGVKKACEEMIMEQGLSDEEATDARRECSKIISDLRERR